MHKPNESEMLSGNAAEWGNIMLFVSARARATCDHLLSQDALFHLTERLLCDYPLCWRGDLLPNDDKESAL